ncbi:MAG TPA: rRNA pseudouridine synthase [Kosmotogaceae bacterium]|nr:rRNA pseudouridine synthase [Kosmotogaceae bacterium]
MRSPWQEIEPAGDTVCIEGERILPIGNERLVVAINKPPGYITAMSDDRNRPTVGDLIREHFQTPLFHVGRLDRDTEGLLIMTNDGQLAHEIAHPSSSVCKTYLARIAGALHAQEINLLRRGILLRDGFRTGPAEVRILEQTHDTSLVEIIIKEGHKRQVREMFSSLGKQVLSLTRTAIGGITIDLVPGPGDIRILTKEETRLLRRKKGTC